MSAQQPKARPVIPKLAKGATWLGTPLDQMNAKELRLIIAYKVHECLECYNIMSPEQAKFVGEKMRNVTIPTIVRSNEPSVQDT